MKTIMSINQYKQYKNNEINILDIKLQNIGINRKKIETNTITYLLKNKKYIITLLILFAGYIGSEVYLNNGLDSINTFNYNFNDSIDLFSFKNSSIGNI
jgi:hypothetical protein